ncbi:MAG: hypothetical protein VW276_09550 [Burkholderiaceae bacterium]
MGGKLISHMTKNDFFETLLSVSFFAVLYFLLYQVQVKVLSDFDFLPMASILFIPAGIKFLAMVVGQGPGVVGIALGFALVEINAGKTLDLTAFLTHVLLWLVLPYALLRGYLAKSDLKNDLTALTTYQPFVMGVIVSLTSSLGTQLYFFGLHDPQYPVLKGVWSMTIGDLSGIFLSLAFVVAMRRVFARRTRTN